MAARRRGGRSHPGRRCPPSAGSRSSGARGSPVGACSSPTAATLGRRSRRFRSVRVQLYCPVRSRRRGGSRRMATTKKTTKTSPSGRKATTHGGRQEARRAGHEEDRQDRCEGHPREEVRGRAKQRRAKKAAAAQQAATTEAGGSDQADGGRQAAADAARRRPSTVLRGDHDVVPAPRGHTKDGIAYTKDFDAKFLKSQRDLLTAERQVPPRAGRSPRGRGQLAHRGRRDGRRAVRRRER